MTLPNRNIMSGFQAAFQSMAGRTTPFVFNEWYCAGFSKEFGDSLLPKTILGRKLVFYRTSKNEVVALEDRCAHRSYPLSKGHIENDEIVCGYHGFCYDSQGDCVRVPAMDKPPRHVGLARYITKERGRIVWIWMGDELPSEREEPPVQPFMVDEGWESLTGYLHLPANYVCMHENLLDLTHIEFLHAKTLGRGAKGMAAAPYETHIDGESIWMQRTVQPAGMAPVFAQTTGLGQITTARRVTRTDYISPAFEQVTASYSDGSLPEASRREFTVKTAHLLTPETQSTSHYFIDHTWNWPIEDPQMRALMHKGLFDAFEEDVVGLAFVEESLGRERGWWHKKKKKKSGEA